MTKSIDVVREIYAAFERGDMERVFGLLDEDIAWIEPAGYWVSPGGVRGLAEVERTLAAYPERWTENVLEPETFLEAGDHVVVLGGQHGTARETGDSYRGRFANVWLIRDGKAVAFEAFSDTALMWKALGGTPAA